MFVGEKFTWGVPHWQVSSSQSHHTRRAHQELASEHRYHTYSGQQNCFFHIQQPLPVTLRLSAATGWMEETDPFLFFRGLSSGQFNDLTTHPFNFQETCARTATALFGSESRGSDRSQSRPTTFTITGAAMLTCKDIDITLGRDLITAVEVSRFCK